MAAIDIRLNITDLLQGLVSEGRLGADEADRIRLKSRTTEQRLWHPIELIAEADAPDLQQPGERWTLERLSRWLSEHYEQPYFHIDPLKIETQQVTGWFQESSPSVIRSSQLKSRREKFTSLVPNQR